MEKNFLDRVQDNAAVRAWSEKLQFEKGDSLAEGYTSELQDYTRISVTQNELQELRDIWTQWECETKQMFYYSYGDISYLLDVKIDKNLFRAMVQCWNSAYSCFTFGNVDLVPTIEEYTTLLRSPRIQADKVYIRPAYVPPFAKKLMKITGMSEEWILARIQQKGEGRCIPWVNLRDLILTNPDVRRKVDIFALSIYGLVIFPKALRHIDEAVVDLFDRLDKQVTPVPAILAETFRSLNACRRTGEGRFIGCAQLLTVWFYGHFWKMDKASCRPLCKGYSPLKEEVAMSRREDITEEGWTTIFQNLQEEDIEWKAPWMVPEEVLYRCGDFNWVPLPGIWGAIGYAPLLATRQYNSRQFVPATYGLVQSEFSYTGESYKKKIREVEKAWKQTRRMKTVTVGERVTPEYKVWLSKRVNDNIPRSSLDNPRSIEECLRAVPSELEIIKQDFEKKNRELEKKIEQLEEEKMHLGLDADVQKAEAEKFRKGKERVEEDLNSLKTDYKKMRLSMRTAGLGKTPDQWRQEIQGERVKANQWEEKFREAQTRNELMEKNLSESQGEQNKLKARVAELERSLQHQRNRNSMKELRTSLSQIEEMKKKIVELEMALLNCQSHIQSLEANKEQREEELHRSQNQVRDRDYLMGEAIIQMREIAEYLQTLAIQADVLSMQFETRSDRGRELTSLLTKIKALGVRAKPYL